LILCRSRPTHLSTMYDGGNAVITKRMRIKDEQSRGKREVIRRRLGRLFSV
jgi:hypothetical protein